MLVLFFYNSMTYIIKYIQIFTLIIIAIKDNPHRIHYKKYKGSQPYLSKKSSPRQLLGAYPVQEVSPPSKEMHIGQKIWKKFPIGTFQCKVLPRRSVQLLGRRVLPFFEKKVFNSSLQNQNLAPLNCTVVLCIV